MIRYYNIGYSFFDIEDYYFPNKNINYVYDIARTRDEVENLLLNDINMCENFILASVKGDFGDEIVSQLTTAVYISVDKEIRLQRVRERSFSKFGKRILPGGDLYENEKLFFDMVESRTEQSVKEWLKIVNCKILNLNGTESIDENVEKIINKLYDY